MVWNWLNRCNQCRAQEFDKKNKTWSLFLSLDKKGSIGFLNFFWDWSDWMVWINEDLKQSNFDY